MQIMDILSYLQSKRYFEYIFIDCPPQLGTLLINALVAADDVIIPVKTDYLSYRGLGALLETIQSIQSGDGDRSLNPDLNLLGIIATMYDKKVNDQRDVFSLLQDVAPVLGIIKWLDDAKCHVVDGLPVVLTHKRSDASKEYIKISQLYL